MASGVDPVASEATPLGSQSPNNPSDSIISDGIARPPKRQREVGSASPRDRTTPNQFNSLESPTKSARLAFATNSKSPPPPPLPDTSGLQDDRQRQPAETLIAFPAPSSPPSGYGILESLMSAANKAMNHHTEAPKVAPTANMDPTVKAVSTISTPVSGAPRVDGHGESSPHSTTSLTGAPGLESPTVMEIDVEKEGPNSTQVFRGDHPPQTGSFSYPGPIQTAGPPPESSSRVMSLPGSNQVHGSPSASGGMAKARARAQAEDPAWEASRMGKLWTAPGIYENGDDEELRRQSLPGVSTSQHAPSGHADAYGAHSRTYPPAGQRPAGSGLYPPTVNRVQASASNTGSSSLPGSMANASSSCVSPIHDNSGMYSQAGMTESPKPLSPGLQVHDSPGPARQRSPSPQRQFPQQSVCRRQIELQSPQSGSQSGTSRPKLPGLSHPGFAAPGFSAHNHGRLPSGVQPGSDSENMFAHSDPNLWAYIQTLEDKVKVLTERVTSLDQEMKDLKSETRKGAATG
ncbi:hypothetical protein CP532_3713 [Ophiocordyceps camponoti-leonardi (nom. inval.)]|nr:hypothetical protein CP532_3713 [Ophiocordyceps camponoti-leonardi (nom. inval.)]